MSLQKAFKKEIYDASPTKSGLAQPTMFKHKTTIYAVCLMLQTLSIRNSNIVIKSNYMDSIRPHEAVARMKELTEQGVHFSIKFCSYSTKSGKSEGFKTVHKALLRKSLRNDQSDLSHQLIAYVDVSQPTDKNRFFHLPLLLQFNNYLIKP
jgi:hypothetical protein